MLTQQQSASFFTDILCFYYLNPSVSKKTMIENQYMNFIHSYLTTLSNDWHSVRYDLLFSLYMKGKNQEACECCFDLFYHLIHQHQINIQQIKKNMFTIVLDKISEYFDKNQDNDEEKVSHRADKVTYYSEYNPEVIGELKNEWAELSEQRQKILDKC